MNLDKSLICTSNIIAKLLMLYLMVLAIGELSLPTNHMSRALDECPTSLSDFHMEVEAVRLPLMQPVNFAALTTKTTAGVLHLA
jgi:hypothetical protein